MIPFALLLLAAANPLSVVEDTITIEAGKLETLTITMRQRPAVMDGSLEVLQGGDVGLSLIARTDAGDLFLRRIADSSSATFRQPITRPGDYELVFDNRGNNTPATALVKVDLLFDAEGLDEPVNLTAARRSVIVGLSLLFLSMISVWFARRMSPAIAMRKRAAPRPPY